MKFTFVTTLVLLVYFNNIQAQTVHICDDGAEFPPYIYYERINGKPDKSRLTGATEELLTEIFKLIDMKYTLKLIPWKRCLSRVEHFGSERKYEMFSNGSYSEKRAQKYYVTTPIYKTHEGLWYSKNKFPKRLPIHKPTDLNKFHRVCGVLGNNYNWLTKYGVTVKLKTGATTPQAALNKVSLGRCDFFVAGLENTYGAEKSGQYTIPNDVVGIPFPGGREPTFHLFITKTSPRAYELHTKINQAILLLQYRGIAEKIFKNYLPGGDGL